MPIPHRVKLLLGSAAVAAACLGAPARVRAQEQERSLRDRIERPNMDLHASGFEKTFTPTAAGVDKSVSSHPFAFTRAAGTKGDGWFHTGLFATDKFKTGGFGTKKSFQTDRNAAQSDRAYGTKAMEVREDQAANKSAAARNYQPSEKPFISHGKRQDEMDELRRQKQLSIDQVREILNKNK